MKEKTDIVKALGHVLTYSQNNNYSGYNKYDALDSPFLRFMSLGNKWIRLVYSQVVMRFPLNLRPLLFVPKTPNPKGFALFAMTYLNLYQAFKKENDLQEAERLLQWLKEHRSPHYPTICWGYQYPWQDVGFFAKAHLPNRVVTYFVCTAFLNAYDITGKEEYLDIVEEALEFMLKAPKVLYEDDNMKCLSYVPDEGINWIVMDVSALTASLCARFHSYRNNEYILGEATKLIRFVVDKKTDYGAWFYSHPAGDHSKMHDNYHTGYICDAILDYSNYSGNAEFMPAYEQGIEYYRKFLFLDDGTPRWMNNATYPIDVHGSAQGIISFLKASEKYPEFAVFARTIAEWAVENMQNKKHGWFNYQKTRLFRKPYTLMHWSNGWMARAMSELVRFEEVKSKQN
jgi:hypothetical protein